MLFLVGRSAVSGTIRKKIDLAAKAQDTFRPIAIADGKEGRLVLLTLRTDGVSAAPVLNGTSGMTMVNRPGTGALEAVKSGQNLLQIDFKGKFGEELKFSVAAPDAFRSFTRQIGSKGEHTESVTFMAP